MGVELGKLIAKETYQAMQQPELVDAFDCSTAGLLNKVKGL